MTDRHTSIPPGIVDRIEEFLSEFEESEVDRGVAPEEARARTDEMENLVYEAVRSDSAKRTSMARLEEFLAGLGAEEKEEKVTPLFESFPEGPKLPTDPRIPRITLWAGAWMATFFLMLGLVYLPAGLLNDEDPSGLQILLVTLVVTLGLTAPVGTTVLAMVGLRIIQYGKGKFVGERLTTGLAVSFPTALFAYGVYFFGKKLLGGTLEEPALGWVCLLPTLVLSYFWIQFQLRLFRDWILRMRISDTYWKRVGDIPPSRRESRYPREVPDEE